VTGSWFTGNTAQFGGALSSYRALIGVAGSVFQGNGGNPEASDLAVGGAICALSNDSPDSSTAGGQNPRPAGVTIAGSLFQGNLASGGAPLANAGACILAAGDANHLYGLGGLTPNGTLQSNRATVAVSGSVFDACDIQAGPAGGGAGGAFSGALVALTLDSSLVLDSSAAGGSGAGGGIYVSGESAAAIERTAFAGNTAGLAGGALYGTGSAVDVSASLFVAGQVAAGAAGPVNESRGAALYFQPLGSGQPHAGSGDASGIISGSTFSQNAGLPLWDVDLAGPGPINIMQYGGNGFYSTAFGGKVYVDTLADPGRTGEDVAALNSLVVSHGGGPAVVKSPVPNTALATPPAAGSLLAVPPAGAPGATSPAFLAYAWSGGSATLDGAPLARLEGPVAGAAQGTHTLVVDGRTVATLTLPPAEGP
jgi:predicted outer membrane repeat protein